MSNLSTVKSQIYQAVVDIRVAGRQATRALIAERTGMKLAVVDDHVKTLCDDGKLRKVVPGVVEPADVFPMNRPVSKTVLAEGGILLEVGDMEMMLTPGEARVVGLALHGDAMELAHVKGEREVYDTVATLKRELRATGRQLAELMKDMAALAQRSNEPDLFTETR